MSKHTRIFTGFSPNSTSADIRTALGYLCFPWKWFSWRKGPYPQKVVDFLSQYLGVSHVYTIDSGRSALYVSLKALGIKAGDDVIVQSYTCAVVVNAITWLEARPIFVDVAPDLNMDIADLEKKITSKTKAIIIQHTFGKPADIDAIMAIANNKGIAVIEDAAHALGATYKGSPVGTRADIGMFSFGSDKIVSCVRGGALVTNNAQYAQEIEKILADIRPLPLFVLWQHLMHYPLFAFGKRFYGVYIGKIVLYLARRLKIMNEIISSAEKVGKRVSYIPAALPNALAHIALMQLTDLDENIAHRQELARIYSIALSKNQLKEHLTHPQPISKSSYAYTAAYVRYPLLCHKNLLVIDRAKKQGIILGDWYLCPIAPCDCVLPDAFYTIGSCPHAEAYAEKSLNLPTSRHITPQDAKRICKLFYDIFSIS